MTFEIKDTSRRRFNPDQEPIIYWTLRTKDGPICRSAQAFQSERDARSNIAEVKNTMKAARFAKVEVVE